MQKNAISVRQKESTRTSKEKMVSTTVYLNADQYDRLVLLSQRTHKPVAAYIREGIDKILQKNI